MQAGSPTSRRTVGRSRLWSAYPARTRTPGRGRWLPALVAGVAVLTAWVVVARAGIVDPILLPDPVAVLHRVADWTSSGVLATYLLPTLGAAALGTALAVAVALPLGVVLAHSPLLGAALGPFVAFSQAVPLVAVAPLLVLWLGYGTLPIAVLCAVVAFFPMVTTTVVGLRSLDMRMVDHAWLDGAGWWARLRHVEAPVAAPSILAGVRAGVVLSMTGAIVGEFVMGGAGLGTLLTLSREAADTTGVFAVLAVLAVVALTLNALFHQFERMSARRLQGEDA